MIEYIFLIPSLDEGYGASVKKIAANNTPRKVLRIRWILFSKFGFEINQIKRMIFELPLSWSLIRIREYMINMVH